MLAGEQLGIFEKHKQNYCTLAIALTQFIFIIFLLQQQLPPKAENLSENQKGVISKSVGDLQLQVFRWRRMAGELSCKLYSKGVGPTGGWCLRPHPTSDDLAANHVAADQAIFLETKHLLANNSVNYHCIG